MRKTFIAALFALFIPTTVFADDVGLKVEKGPDGTTLTVDGKVIAKPDAPKGVVVDMTTILLDQDDRPIIDEFDRQPGDDACKKCRALTLGAAVAHALFFVSAEEREVTPEQKWAWATFAMQIRNEKTAKIDNAQGDLIYRRLGKVYNGVVLMRAMPMINPNKAIPEIK